MNDTTNTQTWLDQVSTVNTRVLSALEALGETERLHVESLAQELSVVAPSIPSTTLKLMISSLVEATPGFLVRRGKYGGALRDNEANRPKASVRAEQVAARKAEREQRRVEKEAAKEAARAEKAAKSAQEAEQAAAAAADAVYAANDQDSADESEAV